MKKTYHILILICIIILAFLFTQQNEVLLINSNVETENNDSYKEYRSDGTQEDLEEIIKNEVSEFMYDNYGSVFKTTWYDSISATSAVINSYGKFYIVQSKGDEYNDQARQYVQGVLSYFNDKTLDKPYKVDKVILLNQEYNNIFEYEIVKW